ncbi:MAG: hypothetical protein ACRDCT_08165 [Shewanella sp.]|uniref:hypothetical protein n=1 Tax=Shewanella sp. TaxID=50422 RepID=UPI003F2C1A0B
MDVISPNDIENKIEMLFAEFEAINGSSTDVNPLGIIPFIVNRLAPNIEDGRAIVALTAQVCNALYQMDYHTVYCEHVH